MQLLALLLTGVLAQTDAAPEETALADHISIALDDVAASVGERQVLVLVAEHSDNESEFWPAVVEIRDILVENLGAAGIAVLENTPLHGQVAHTRWDGFPSGQQLADWQEEVSFDAVLCGVYENHDTSPALDLLLLEAASGERLWTARIEIDPAEIDGILPLNKGVLEYAQAHRGYRVGDGQCWALAAYALNNAGARRRGSYIFGKQIAWGDRIVPGDVLQFEGAWFRGRYPNSMYHHTAIVHDVLGATELELIHQNVGGRYYGVVTKIDLAELQGGSVRIYRPTP